jgi:hypothetical protein
LRGLFAWAAFSPTRVVPCGCRATA